jgi:hypothetical protein
LQSRHSTSRRVCERSRQCLSPSNFLTLSLSCVPTTNDDCAWIRASVNCRPSIVLRLTSNVLTPDSLLLTPDFPSCLPVLPVSIPLVSLCLGGECFSFCHQRRTTTVHGFARPSSVCRLTSIVSRLAPCLRASAVNPSYSLPVIIALMRLNGVFPVVVR